MKPKQIILIILILFVVNSCEKDAFFNKTKVEGIVTVKQTREPIENITVTIKKILSPRYSKTIAEFITDENGYYYYEFRAEKDFDYKVLGKSDSCYNFQNLNNVLEKGEKNIYDFTCWPYISVVLHIVNKYPFDEYDKFELYYCKTQYNEPNLIENGINVNMYYLCSGSSIRTLPFYRNFSYLVTKNNITTEYIDSNYITSFCSYDTITINY
ncbi:MAG: hypothetical protein U9Q83_05965 [Bacteroidota bacterium]|nr:hypothetical protein [Bacteroidota bacterium]